MNLADAVAQTQAELDGLAPRIAAAQQALNDVLAQRDQLQADLASLGEATTSLQAAQSVAAVTP